MVGGAGDGRGGGVFLPASRAAGERKGEVPHHLLEPEELEEVAGPEVENEVLEPLEFAARSGWASDASDSRGSTSSSSEEERGEKMEEELEEEEETEVVVLEEEAEKNEEDMEEVVLEEEVAKKDEKMEEVVLEEEGVEKDEKMEGETTAVEEGSIRGSRPKARPQPLASEEDGDLDLKEGQWTQEDWEIWKMVVKVGGKNKGKKRREELFRRFKYLRKTGQWVGDEPHPLGREARFEARPKHAPSSSSRGC